MAASNKSKSTAPVFETIQGLPARETNLGKREIKYTDFVQAVIDANESAGVTAETPLNERVFLVFPKSGKGVAGNIQGGAYAAFRGRLFQAVTRTTAGQERVLVTVGFETDPPRTKRGQAVAAE